MRTADSLRVEYEILLAKGAPDAIQVVMFKALLVLIEHAEREERARAHELSRPEWERGA